MYRVQKFNEPMNQQKAPAERKMYSKSITDPSGRHRVFLATASDAHDQLLSVHTNHREPTQYQQLSRPPQCGRGCPCPQADNSAGECHQPRQ